MTSVRLPERKWVTHLLFPLVKVDSHELIICEATLGESQADTVRVGRAASAVQGKSWRHFRGKYF